MRYDSDFLRQLLPCFILFFLIVSFAGTALCLELRSSAFENGGNIPVRYTGLGEDVSPPLRWSGIPAGTQSFVLIMDDPDAPMGTWTHWIIYDIPEDADGLDEGIPPKAVLDDGARQGVNSFRRIGYGGPYPPPGPAHRYNFTLYALDTVPALAPGAGRRAIIRAMRGHILDKARLTGRFKRRTGRR